MILIQLVTPLLVSGAALSPVGEANAVEWGKKAIGHQLSAAGLTFEITGPTTVVLELRGGKDLIGQKTEVDITRDRAHRSKNELTFKKKGKGPKDYPLAGELSFSVPEGEHEYLVTAAVPLALLATTTKKLKKKIAAAPEEPLPPPAPGPETETEPETRAAAEPEAPTGTEAAAGTEAETAAEPGQAEAAPTQDAVEAFAAVAATSAEVATRVGSMQRGIRVAVYDLELQGIDKNIGTVVTDSIVAEIRKLDGVSAIGMDEIRDMLSHEANKQILGCESDESCLAEIAGALGVDDLVTGKLSKAADSHVFLLRRIDQRRAVVAGTVNKRLKAESGQEFLIAIGPAVEELFADRTLRAGLKRGVPDEVALRLDPPPLPTWSFWAVAGTAAGAAAVGGVFALLANSAQEQYDSLAEGSVTAPISGADLMAKGNALTQHAMTANGLWIAAGALALAAGVMIPFTDWEGYGDQKE